MIDPLMRKMHLPNKNPRLLMDSTHPWTMVFLLIQFRILMRKLGILWGLFQMLLGMNLQTPIAKMNRQEALGEVLLQELMWKVHLKYFQILILKGIQQQMKMPMGELFTIVVEKD